MSTRRIKNAKDLDTGELIYFKGHAQATFMSDGLNVEETISNLANSQTSSKVELLNSISEKQDALVSGTNIKTINGESILGEGDLTIEGGADIIVTNKSDLDEFYKDVSEGTKAIVFNEGRTMTGINLLDVLTGNIEGANDVILNENTIIKISAVDTDVTFPVSNTHNVQILLPFNNEIIMGMGSDMSSIHCINVRMGFTGDAWYEGVWLGSSFLIGNELMASKVLSLSSEEMTGLMALSPALIVDLITPNIITEYVKNGDNWEIWNVGQSALDAILNAWANTLAQNIPTKTSQLENDSNFITSDGLKTINGESIVGSGDIEISGGGSSSGSSAYAEVNHGTADTTFTLTPNTFHVWDEVASLTLDFGSETSGVANEFLFQFTSGSTATSLTLPDDIKWANDEAPTIAENMIYQVSILKGLASVLEFSNKGNTITFFVVRGLDTYQFACESGMTWEEFINSEYNNNTFAIYTQYNNQIRWVSAFQYGVEGATPSSLIEEGVTYNSKYGS